MRRKESRSKGIAMFLDGILSAFGMEGSLSSAEQEWARQRAKTDQERMWEDTLRVGEDLRQVFDHYELEQSPLTTIQ